MTAISEASIVTAVRDQASCDLAGEAVILHLPSGIYYGLNKVGARVWERLRTPATVAEIRDSLVDEFEVDRETCLEDLLRLLREMREAGLVEIRDGPAG